MTAPLHKLLLAVCASASLCLTGCRLPTEAEMAGTTVRRAEPAGPQGLYAGAGELNVPFRSTSINNIARLLGGLDGNGHNSFAYHQQAMDRLWLSHENRGSAVRDWAASEISDLQAARCLFYPFSGPDFLFAHELFPHADTYILCGLEPAEPLPDLGTLSSDEIGYGLSGLREALTSIMQAGYFVTKDMRSDLQATRFRGTLPILLTFLVRTGNTVESVDIVGLDGSGNVVLTGTHNGSAPGLLIRFRTGYGSSKRLFYFRQDLSNGPLKPGGSFLTFVSKQGYPPALVKSASYLMHEDNFSVIRSYLLRTSRGIVQDPSGVPYRDLASSGHALTLYGNYQGTLGIFNQQQPDLVRAYQSGLHPVKPISFGFGYLYYPSNTSIIVARRR
ncbi:MAG TPA: hypothetical protein VD994_04415 [Prosthecobacter sp.]|nr:hypothetical protein [Prosthecobacter sp.]